LAGELLLDNKKNKKGEHTYIHILFIFAEIFSKRQ